MTWTTVKRGLMRMMMILMSKNGMEIITVCM